LGRDFSEHDDAGAPKVLLLGESTARKFFGKGDPIGKTIRMESKPGEQDVYQVIGVVKDIKYEEVDEKPVLSAYVASAQDSESWGEVTFEVRSERAVETLIPVVRTAIGQVNRGISLEFRNFETQVGESLLQPRMVALLSAFFGGLALLLAMIGLYGVTAYGVARRQAEIGIRMALGAQPGSVIWLVLREVAAMLVAGTLLGPWRVVGRGAPGCESALWSETVRCGATRHRCCSVGNCDRNRRVSARASRRAPRSHGCAARGMN
jgi:ABC-type antimicrobial peptide transport system permease subunit